MTRSHIAHAERTAPGTLLGIWAHPDDEAFLSAGLMALAAGAGERVVVASATLGERGTSDPDRWPPERLAPVRRAELRRSLEVLGVKEHRSLGHHDGDLTGVPGDTAIAQVAELVDEVAPDTIVTFGPEGMTGHDDHRAVSRWVTAAWRLTGRAARLWYATATPSFHATWGRLNREVGVYLPGSRPPSTPVDELACEVVFDEELTERKYAALRAHASQTDGLAARVGEATFRRWWAVEWFVDAQRVHGHRLPVPAEQALPQEEEGVGNAGR
jgi:LmbE family N-acetylglucosaminyl deacetylase